jgi:hypothetical protein
MEQEKKVEKLSSLEVEKKIKKKPVDKKPVNSPIHSPMNAPTHSRICAFTHPRPNAL